MCILCTHRQKEVLNNKTIKKKKVYKISSLYPIICCFAKHKCTDITYQPYLWEQSSLTAFKRARKRPEHFFEDSVPALLLLLPILWNQRSEDNTVQ